MKVYWRWAFESSANPPGVVEVMDGPRAAVEARAKRRIVTEYTDVADIVIVGMVEEK